jgi:hypothetical protein
MRGPSQQTTSEFVRQRWLLVALSLFLIVVHVQYTLKLAHTEHGMRSAFLRWRIQLEDLDEGVNVWEKYAYPNPPIMALILKPFMELPPLLGASLWFACKGLLAMAAVIGVLSLLDTPARPFPWWGKIVTVALCLRPIAGDLVHGNVNLLILFLIVATLVAYVQRRDTLAGVLLALSIACKLTPALFLLYFLWKRAWITLLGAAAGLIVFVLLLPALAFGWTENLDYLQSWHNQMIAPYAAGIVSSEHKNQSLPGVLHRLLTEEPSFSEYDGDRRVVLDTHNLVAWDRQTVQGIVLVCMGLFVVAAMRFCRSSSQERPKLQVTAEFSVVVLGMLLFCERTWKHHCVTLLLPFAVLAFGVAAPTVARGVRWYFGVTLALVALLMLSTSTGIMDRDVEASDRFGKVAQVYGAYVWAFLLLLAGVFVLLARAQAIDPNPPKDA